MNDAYNAADVADGTVGRQSVLVGRSPDVRRVRRTHSSCAGLFAPPVQRDCAETPRDGRDIRIACARAAITGAPPHARVAPLETVNDPSMDRWTQPSTRGTFVMPLRNPLKATHACGTGAVAARPEPDARTRTGRASAADDGSGSVTRRTWLAFWHTCGCGAVRSGSMQAAEQRCHVGRDCIRDDDEWLKTPGIQLRRHRDPLRRVSNPAGCRTRQHPASFLTHPIVPAHPIVPDTLAG